MRKIYVAILASVVLAAGTSSAAVTCVNTGFGYDDCVINNGLAPPNPENVIDHEGYPEGQRVYARNVGCPTNWGDAWVRGEGACASPGGATEVELADGGYVDRLRVLDTSSLTMSGGTAQWALRTDDSSSATLNGGWALDVWAYGSSSVTLGDGFATRDVSAYDSATVTLDGAEVQRDLQPKGFSHVTMSGGTVGRYLQSSDSPTITLSGGWVSQLWAGGSSDVTMSGGTVWSQLVAIDSSTITISGGVIVGGLGAAGSSIITIEGTDFKVDDASVPFGNLSAETGRLTGTLASGELIDTYFSQGQGEGAYYAGTITLVPEPTAELLYACALATLALLRRRAHSR